MSGKIVGSVIHIEITGSAKSEIIQVEIDGKLKPEQWAEFKEDLQQVCKKYGAAINVKVTKK